MISVHFNDEVITIEKCSLAQLLEQMEMQNKGYAVMLNRSFIPLSEHQRTILQENDKIELIAPMQGG